MVRFALLSVLLVLVIACEELPTATPLPAREPTPTPVPAPTPTPMPQPPLEVSAADLLMAYDQNKFQADLRFKYADNGGRLLRVKGYVTDVLHDYFTMSEGPENLLDFNLDFNAVNTINCHYADDSIRLTPSLLAGEWITVTGQGEGEDSFGMAVELTGCHDLEGTGQSEVLAPESSNTPEPTPTPLVFQQQGSGSDVFQFEAVHGNYVATLRVSGNADCSLGSCFEEFFFVTMEDAQGLWIEVLAEAIATEWEGRALFRVGGDAGFTPGVQFVEVMAHGDWSITLTQQ